MRLVGGTIWVLVALPVPFPLGMFQLHSLQSCLSPSPMSRSGARVLTLTLHSALLLVLLSFTS